VKSERKWEAWASGKERAEYLLFAVYWLAGVMLDDLRHEPVTDPTPLYRVRDSLYAIDLLAAAVVHLDLFTWLADHPSTLGAICVQFDLKTRPADVLLTLCTAMGLTTQAGGCFHLTIRAREFFNAASPFSIVPYYASLRDRPQTLEMVKVLRTGQTAGWGSYDPDEWARAMERPDFAAQFTAAMDCRGVHFGAAMAKQLDLADCTALLDIGGGSGIYACAVVAHHPHLRAAVFDKPPVDRIARENIARRGAADKVDVIAGDVFAGDQPRGYDCHLISNVLHDWDEGPALEILRKSAAALPAGGLLVVHDAFINAEKTGPLPVAQYSVLLMHSTQGKCYSLGEMRTYLGATGFDFLDHRPTAADRSYILARKI
jgi:acetylserotonin N-methyltransferase